MLMMKCVKCNKKSEYIYDGHSVCKKHFFKKYVDEYYKLFLTAKNLKRNDSIYDIPTKEQVIEEVYPRFVSVFGKVKE